MSNRVADDYFDLEKHCVKIPKLNLQKAGGSEILRRQSTMCETPLDGKLLDTRLKNCIPGFRYPGNRSIRSRRIDFVRFHTRPAELRPYH